MSKQISQREILLCQDCYTEDYRGADLGMELWAISGDFEKVFDSVDQEVLWMILRHNGIPEKIVSMIWVFYDRFQERVLHDGDMTEPIRMSTGV